MTTRSKRMSIFEPERRSPVGLVAAVAASLATLCLFTLPSVGSAALPNVVFILADDLGYADAGPYKNATSPIPTPNIDALAAQGLRFTDAHSATSVCAPSRYSALTGNYPFRGRDARGIWLFNLQSDLRQGQKTVGDVMQAAGYRTAFIGKLHLGGNFYQKNSSAFYRGSDISQIDFSRPFEDGPNQHGFDYSWVLSNGIQGQVYAHFENGHLVPISPAQPLPVPLAAGPLNGGRIPQAGYGDANWDSRALGATLVQKAVSFIDTHRQQHGDSKPFMLFYSMSSIHEPHTPPDTLNGIPIKGATGLDDKADMIYETDVQVGQIVAALEAHGIADDTLIIFTSDNGGLNTAFHSNRGHDSVGTLRGKKTVIYEGGHRVPFIAKWGDGTPAGSRIAPGSVSTQLIGLHDWVASMYALTGQPFDEEQARDSHNILPILLGQHPAGVPLRDELVLQAAHWGEQPNFRALRKDEWVLIVNGQGNPVELYDLSNDLSQQFNVIASPANATRVNEMMDRYNWIVTQSTRSVPIDVPGGRPTLDAGDATAGEAAGAMTFTVSLTPANATGTVTVDFSTSNADATAGTDYETTVGTLTFAPGVTSQPITVTVLDDSTAEGVESFNVSLSNAVNADIGEGTATGTIVDDDSSACGSPTVNPGSDRAFFLWRDCGTGDWYARTTAAGGYALFRGSIESSLGFVQVSPFSIESTDILDYTSDPTVLAFELSLSPPNVDGVQFRLPTGSALCVWLNAPANVPVLVGAGRVVVPSPFNPETLGPCVAPAPALSIADIAVAEGSGSIQMLVSMSPAAPSPVTVDYQSSDLSALAGSDYVAASGTLLFDAGATSAAIPLMLIDDGSPEGTEELRVTMSNATGANIVKAIGTASIVDDDSSDCGEPAINLSADRALFIWRDCVTSMWHVRVAAAGGYAQFTGSIQSTSMLTGQTGYSLEASDVFDTATSPQAIGFTLRLSPPNVDGFSFAQSTAAPFCLSLSQPGNATVHVGPARTPVAVPVNPWTQGPCP